MGKKLSQEDILAIIYRIRMFMEEGDSISLARGKGIGRPLPLGVVEQVMRHPEYVKILNEYMVRIDKPIFYVLMETPKGLRLVALNKKKAVPAAFKKSFSSEELLPQGDVR